MVEGIGTCFDIFKAVAVAGCTTPFPSATRAALSSNRFIRFLSSSANEEAFAASSSMRPG
jgi:hypothetical protein